MRDRDEIRPEGARVIRFPSNGRRRAAPAVTPPLRTVLGEVLRAQRHEQRRTIADVADAASVSLPYLSEVERGRKEISSELLTAVCDALEVPVADVLERCVGRLRARSQGGSGIQMRAA